MESMAVLQMMEATALGSGSLKKEDRERIIRHHTDIVGGVKQRARKLTFEVLQQLGIPVAKK